MATDGLHKHSASACELAFGGVSKEALYAESSHKMNHVVKTIQPAAEMLDHHFFFPTNLDSNHRGATFANAWDIEAAVEDKSSALSRT
jgi:hypothetical protein